jgi:hypothetical protein
MRVITHICTGARGYSICEKIETSLKAQKKQVSRNEKVRIAVRLRNRSGGDVDEGTWFLQLPPGVAFVSSSLPSLRKVGNMIILDPVVVHSKKSITFTIQIKIEPTASGRLVFHSFLTNPDINCQDVASVTVSFLYVCSSFTATLPDYSLPLVHSIVGRQRKRKNDLEIIREYDKS